MKDGLSTEWTDARVRLQHGYAVKSNTDLNEGRGRRIVLAYARTQSAAEEVGKGRYVMGTNCPICKASFVEIQVAGRSFFAAQDHIQPEDLLVSGRVDRREAALAKLTAGDREVLGLVE